MIYNNNDKRAKVKVLYDEFGVRLEFLPPYSPGYKPIKEFFAKLKARTRKKRDLALHFGDDVRGFIELVV